MRLMTVLLGVAVILFCPLSVDAQDHSSEEAVIRALWRQFEAYYMAGDFNGIADLYAEDADRGIPDSAELALGRDAIRELYRREVQEHGGAPIRDTIRVRLLRPDVAILDGHFDYEDADGKKTGRYTVILTKDDGRWWIAAGRPRGSVPRS